MERTTSLWEATTHIPARGPLTGDMQADVCAIGAGMTGMTTAYLLARQGLSVIVLEARTIGAGETSNTTAHFTWIPDSRLATIERMHGMQGLRLMLQSHLAAMHELESIWAGTEWTCCECPPTRE